MLTRNEFFEFLAWGFGLDPAAEKSKTRFLLELTKTLTERQGERGATALIIDESSRSAARAPRGDPSPGEH